MRSFITKFFVLWILVFGHAREIHRQMTDDEIKRIFRAPRHAVPIYEVVPVSHSLHNGSLDGVQLVKMAAFDKNIELYLKPTEGILFGTNTPVYSVFPDKSQPLGLRYRKLRDPYKGIGKAYQDVKTDSAVVLTKELDGCIRLVGKIVKNLFIEPLPERFKQLFRQRRSANETDTSSENIHHHIVFERPAPSHDEIQKGMRLLKRGTVERQTVQSSIRQLPTVIYPQVLVIMDYNLYKTQNENFRRAMLYLLAFWNAVDLRYRLMSSPRVKLNIAGFIISTEKGGTPYIEDHRREMRELDADLALEAMSKYFYKESRFPFLTYDFAVGMTSLNLCNLDGPDYCDTATLGYAYEAGACNRSSVDQNTEAVGIVEDNGGYSSIVPTAHEVGHLMGIPHDGTEDTIHCHGYHGFLMAPALTVGENQFYWSNCSIDLFRDFVRSPDGTCLVNHPAQDVPLPRILPGKILSLDGQCQKLHGTKACKNDASVCTSLSCYIKNSTTCWSDTAAAEGSPCGQDMHCLNGHCLPESATELADPPDFSLTKFIPKIPKYNPKS